MKDTTSITSVNCYRRLSVSAVLGEDDFAPRGPGPFLDTVDSKTTHSGDQPFSILDIPKALSSFTVRVVKITMVIPLFIAAMAPLVLLFWVALLSELSSAAQATLTALIDYIEDIDSLVCGGMFQRWWYGV